MAQVTTVKYSEINTQKFEYNAEHNALKLKGDDIYFVLKRVNPDDELLLIRSIRNNIELLIFPELKLVISSYPHVHILECSTYRDLVREGVLHLNHVFFNSAPEGFSVFSIPYYIPFVALYDDILISTSKNLSVNESVSVVNPLTQCGTQTYKVIKLDDFNYILIREG